nr:WecB/TagA/CpsF family glycosyltransferase [Anaerolineae bacterium]
MKKHTDSLPRANILGIGVTAINLSTTVSVLLKCIADRQKTAVVLSPAFTLTYARQHEYFREIINQAELVLPDGVPIALVCRLQGHREVGRVCGRDLMLALSAASREHHYTHYFYGGDDGVAEELQTEMKRRYPGLQIAGTYSPPYRTLTDEEKREITDRINRANPDIVWVGLGSPKQDIWIAEHHDSINAPVMIGVGAAFDFHAGRKPSAPEWMQRIALEWLFRLMLEPRRLWRRYLIYNLLFLFYLGLQATGIRRWEVQ